MIPNQFNYAAPADLNEVLALLADNSGAVLLAGGQSLVTDLKLRRTAPSLLVDLHNISSLRGIAHEGGSLRIGAMVTCTQLIAAPEVGTAYRALVEAAASNGDVQVRNAGTIGGNLVYSDPGADLPAAALALDAVIHVAGPHGTRTIPSDEFFTGAYETSLAPHEILVAVELPAARDGDGSAYEKFSNPANNFAICGVAAHVTRAADGTVDRCRVAVTGATSHATRLQKVESTLTGRAATAGTIAAAAARASEGLRCRSDLFASDSYRAHLTTVLAERALLRAAGIG